MGLTPLPDPLAVLVPAEVVFVSRAAQPPTLTGGLGSPPTLRQSAIGLTSAIAVVTALYLVAMQALKGGRWLHQGLGTKPKKASPGPPSRRKTHLSHPGKKIGMKPKKTEEKKSCVGSF
jgi:hypothetical protein